MVLALPTELAAARLRLVHDQPYLGAALWSLVPVERAGLGTMAVDRWWRLYYDPAVTTTWTPVEMAGVLEHEVAHLLRDHFGRAESLSADPCGWNLAADAEINDDLLAGGRFPLPGSPVTPASLGQPEGRLAEEYYAALADGKGRKKSPAGQGGEGSARDQNQGSGQNPPSGEEGGNTGNSGETPSSSSRNGREADRPSPGEGRCGSCTTGRQEPWEDPAPGTTPGAAPGVTQVQAEIIRRQVAREIVRIAQSSKTTGSIPVGWRRWAETVLRATVDWRRILAAAIRRAVADTSGAADYSYRRPSRRQSAAGDVILPALRAPIPEVAVVVDTSGSIDDRLLSQALAEVARVLRGVGSRGAAVLAVDAAVQFCRRVFQPRQIQLRGGGGTNMSLGIAAALSLRPRPDVVVVLTDGYTPWPEVAPSRTRVVVGLLGGDGNRPAPPAWARVVEIRDSGY